MLAWTHAGARNRALDDGKPHGTHLIARMKRLLPERSNEQLHQIGSDVPGMSGFLKFQESIAFMSRHFQDVLAERHG